MIPYVTFLRPTERTITAYPCRKGELYLFIEYEPHRSYPPHMSGERARTMKVKVVKPGRPEYLYLRRYGVVEEHPGTSVMVRDMQEFIAYRFVGSESLIVRIGSVFYGEDMFGQAHIVFPDLDRQVIIAYYE